jgi:hypothetical protein
MSDDSAAERKKPDGSAFSAHLAAIAERNVTVKKAGRAEREEHELVRVRERRDAERRQNADLRAKE